ncbi:hypothetical protein CP533_0108 [Ophiocordyceps camponoti-saundersi (nom. inval.)]|nr:hypothetical protein CP533_0108 [Ophiocordyceps camponoti-saundersi (nom. inval.)]
MRFTSLCSLVWAAQLVSCSSKAEEYDYIIAGAGVCGLVLANRLSQDSKFSVAVIEPGTDQRNNRLVQNPLAYFANIAQPDLNYNYSSEPEVDADGRVVYINAGRGIGGSSLVNGMVYIRGDKAQFDAWEELGNPGWNWDQLLPHYKKVEKMQWPDQWQKDLGASAAEENHGTSGELLVGFSPRLANGTLFRDTVQAWKSLGLGFNTDVNSGYTRGVDVCPQTIDVRKNLRWDASRAFYWPVSHRPNLRIIRGTVRRVLWKETGSRKKMRPEASGVEYVVFGPGGKEEKKTIRARREVILSAGALRSPLILERSGVGNRHLLAKQGIKTVIHLPGVGENLMDQSAAGIMYHAKDNLEGQRLEHAMFVTVRDLFGGEFEKMKEKTRASLDAWAKRAARDASHGGSEAEMEAFAAATKRVLELQFRLLFEKEVTAAELMTSDYRTFLGSGFWGLIPFSRGSAHIGGPDPDRPVLRPRFISAEIDAEILIATGKMAMRAWTKPSLSKHITPVSISDPPRVEAPYDEWRKWAGRMVGSGLHPIGTAAMMSRQLGGVVDSELAVYGASRLRVVDGSVLPLQFSAMTMTQLIILTLLVLLTCVGVVVFQMRASRPSLPPDAPGLFRGWPVFGCVDFFRGRRDFLLRGRDLSPSRQFSFFYGPHPIVAVSGPAARASFFTSRGLDLGAGFAALYAATPSIDHLRESDLSVNFTLHAKRLLQRERLEATLPRMVADADLAIATTDTVTEPFALMLRLVYQLTHRTLGSNDVADDASLLDETLAVFGRLDSSSALEIMFPKLFTPNKLRKLIAGLKLHRAFSRVADERRRLGRKDDDAMQVLMDVSDNNVQVSAFIISALFAGLINSTFNAAWILVYLAETPEWYSRIRSEVDAAIAKRSISPDETAPKTLTRLTLADWESEFPMVELAMRETIRLIGRGVCMRKNVSGKDIEIGESGLVIPKNAFAVCGLEDAHFDGSLYEDPDRWDPDRYLPGREEDKQGQHAFLGWGSGLHPCLGMRFAKLEITITTVTMFANYDFRRCDKLGDDISTPLPGLVRNSIGEKRPSHDIFLKCTPRC